MNVHDVKIGIEDSWFAILVSYYPNTKNQNFQRFYIKTGQQGGSFKDDVYQQSASQLHTK